MTLNIAELRRLEAEQIQEKVARHLCKLMDDEWGLGRKLYMDTAKGILDDIALPELLKAVEWQPIETAPRDQHIFLFGMIDPLNPFDKIKWDKPAVFSGYWDPIDEIWTPHGGTWEGPFMTATHWRPLPLPPHGGVDVG